MYAILRIGPYICGEWNYGYVLSVRWHLIFIVKSSTNLCVYISCFSRGLPAWLRDIPDMQFRLHNQPFEVLLHSSS
jgi:hypothetical protein